MIGVSVRHGPHQGAQKSTTTGMVFEASRTSRSNVAGVTSMSCPSETLGIVRRGLGKQGGLRSVRAPVGRQSKHRASPIADQAAGGDGREPGGERYAAERRERAPF